MTAPDLKERLLSRAEFEDNGGCCDRQIEDVGGLLRETASELETLEARIARLSEALEDAEAVATLASKAIRLTQAGLQNLANDADAFLATGALADGGGR